MASSDNTNFFIIILITIIFIISVSMVLLSLYFNFGDTISDGFLYFFTETNIFDSTILISKLISRYSIPKSDLLTLGKINKNKDTNVVLSPFVPIGLIPPSTGNKFPQSNRYFISGPTYPFYYNASPTFSDDIINNIFKSDTSKFKSIKMNYVVNYGVQTGPSLYKYSKKSFFKPFTPTGGSTFNTDAEDGIPIFQGNDKDLLYGQACIIKRNRDLINKHVFLTLGVQFEVGKTVYAGDDLSKLNGLIYIVSKVDSTSTNTFPTDTTRGFLNPYSQSDGGKKVLFDVGVPLYTPNAIPFDSLSSIGSINNINQFYPTMMQYYSEANGYTNYKPETDPKDKFAYNSNVDLTNPSPFTIYNTYLLIPDEKLFSGAIADFLVRINLIKPSASNNIASLKSNAQIL